jgi:hypothetical protein
MYGAMCTMSECLLSSLGERTKQETDRSGYLVTGAWESEYGDVTLRNDVAEGARVKSLSED